ncbi:DMT family transporter [Phaeocystidibacter marisrubri]|uniref:DMT family transporter n=2 Tax=Phaeocystidibacter marisrubri TaxID=1577780 RepID=A0A6L3ZM17_9FLAO|nr:DMT family transporter [Phaeocystidibacter marisrubri]
MLISVVCFSAMNLVVKFLGNIPAPELVFFRSVVSFTLSLYFIKRRNLSPFGNNKKWLIARGVFGVTALTTFFYTLQELPLATAITLQYLSPIFTAIFATQLLGEKVKSYQWLFFLISFAGIAMIKGFNEDVDLKFLLLGVMSAVFAGLAYNAIGKVKHTDNPVVVVFYFPLIATPIMGVVSIFYWVQPIGWEWLLLILMGVLTQIAQVYMTKAFQSSAISGLTGMKYLGVVFALGFDFFIFHVAYQPMALLGIGLVIAGVLLNLFFKPRKTKKIKVG